MLHSRRARRVALPSLLLAATACSSDEINAPPQQPEGTITLDASAGWAFASLSEGGAVTVSDPTRSSDWDLGLNATRAMLNGGLAGPAGVAGYCICQNATAGDQEVVAMTAEGELADFESVTSNSVPAEASFEEEQLQTAITGWYSGEGPSAVPEADAAWLVRLADGTSYAKVHIVSIESATAEHAGNVTVEWAVQSDAEAAFGPVQTATLDAASGTRLDLNTGSPASSDTEWDLSGEGWDLRLNGGVSGSGQAAATPAAEPFLDITTAATDPRAYQTDAFAGVFGSHPWYRYNLTGENIIHPTFDVYLLKRGDAVYKIQLIDYYSAAGDPRHISFRYARLTE